VEEQQCPIRFQAWTHTSIIQGYSLGYIWDYLFCLHRGRQGNRYEVWPVTLRQSLPRIHVLLADGDPDVVLDLQAVFNRCYDEGAYARRLDYWRESTPPLQGEDAVWADQVLHDRRLRS
jgi:hypothetical protein